MLNQKNRSGKDGTPFPSVIGPGTPCRLGTTMVGGYLPPTWGESMQYLLVEFSFAWLQSRCQFPQSCENFLLVEFPFLLDNLTLILVESPCGLMKFTLPLVQSQKEREICRNDMVTPIGQHICSGGLKLPNYSTVYAFVYMYMYMYMYMCMYTYINKCVCVCVYV